MSRNKTFETWEECNRWMLEAAGERWVKDKVGDVYKGRSAAGNSVLPGNPVFAPWTAIRDEYGDIPEEAKLPELDAEVVKTVEQYWYSTGPESKVKLKQAFQLAIAQAVRMSKEGK